MTDDLERYEIFIKSVAGFVNRDLTSTIWSWRRLNAGGRILTSGGSLPSLEASFASVRRHAARFGEAPVKINLREPDETVTSIVPYIPAARREAMIARIDHEHARREGRRTYALAAVAQAPPGSIAFHLPHG